MGDNMRLECRSERRNKLHNRPSLKQASEDGMLMGAN